jgi:hypothetical protein
VIDKENKMKKYKSIFKEEDKKKSDTNVSKIIGDLIDTDWSGSNEEQMKAVTLLKGLATSDDAKANKFMKSLDTYTSKMDKEDYK